MLCCTCIIRTCYPMPRKYLKNLDLAALAFCSDFLRSEIKPFIPPQLLTFVIPNGADDACFYPMEENAGRNATIPLVLFVGRLAPDKGAHVFVDAVRKLGKEGIPVKGRIVGCVEFGRAE